MCWELNARYKENARAGQSSEAAQRDVLGLRECSASLFPHLTECGAETDESVGVERDGDKCRAFPAKTAPPRLFTVGSVHSEGF